MTTDPFETEAERKARFYGRIAGIVVNLAMRAALVCLIAWWAVSLTRQVDALRAQVERVEARCAKQP